MLRSIIAIWTLALLLVAVAATSGCSGGCANGDDCSSFGQSVGPDMSTPVVACPSSCSSCGANQFCFQASGAAQLPAFCAHACTDERDCAAGEKCATLFAAQQPAVCVRAHQPQGCGGASPNWHCDLAPAACKDATTAQVAFADADSQVCGWAQVHCANGCANGACL